MVISDWFHHSKQRNTLKQHTMGMQQQKLANLKGQNTVLLKTRKGIYILRDLRDSQITHNLLSKESLIKLKKRERQDNRNASTTYRKWHE